MSRLLTPIAAALSLTMVHSSIAHAQMPPPGTPVVEEEEAPPPVVLRAVPPRFSWDFGVHVGYGMLTQFQQSPAGLGFGFRGGWGRHFGAHRVGLNVGLSLEGPITVQWATLLEPGFSWDYIAPNTKGLYLGLSAGPSLILNADAGATRGYDLTFDAAPFLAFRIGYSQPYSIVARRFWVAVEPKVRVIDGNVNFIGSITLGSGRGY